MGTMNLLGYELMPRATLRCARSLGIATAFSLYVRHAGYAVVSVPGIKYPVTVRRNNLGDLGAFNQVLLQRNYDHAAVRALRNPQTIIDAGAHIGLASVFFANLFPEAKIIALEPDAGNFELLKRNTSPYPNVTAIPAAAWPTQAHLEIENCAVSSWAFTVKESSRGLIPGIPLSSLAAEVDILKVDIEGSEKAIFEQSAVPPCRLLLVETHDRLVAGCSDAVLHSLNGRKFERYQVADVDIFAFPGDGRHLRTTA